MTNYAKLICFASLALLFNSCSFFDSTESVVDFVPAKVDKNDNWGMLGPDGKMLFSDEFENVPSAVINGYFTVEENDGVSVYKADAKPKLVKGLDNLKYAGAYAEGLMPIVRPMQRIEFVNTSGKTEFTLGPVNKKEIIAASTRFQDGLCIIRDEDGKCGAINTKGKVVIKPSFEELLPFNEGYALAFAEDNDKEILYIVNKKGETVVKLEGDDIKPPCCLKVKYGKSVLMRDYRFGYVDLKGVYTKLPSKVKDVSDFNDEYYIYKNEDGDYGVMNFKGEDIVRAKYSRIDFFGDKFLAGRNEKCYLLNKSGDIEKTFDDASGFAVVEGFGAFIGDDDGVFLYDEKGEQVGKEIYEALNLRDVFSDLSEDYVSSDYFDTNGLVSKLLNYVEDGGLAGVKVGESPSKYLDKDNLQQYAGETSFVLDNRVEGGYRYNAKMAIITTEPAVVSEPVYKTEYDNFGDYYYSYDTFDHYDYKINPESKVSDINVVIMADVEFYKDAFDKMVKGLKNKGFKEQVKSEKVFYGTRGSYGIVVCTLTGETNQMVMFYGTAAFAKTLLERVGVDDTDKISEVSDYEVEAPADTVAAYGY